MEDNNLIIVHAVRSIALAVGSGGGGSINDGYDSDDERLTRQRDQFFEDQRLWASLRLRRNREGVQAQGHRIGRGGRGGLMGGYVQRVEENMNRRAGGPHRRPLRAGSRSPDPWAELAALGPEFVAPPGALEIEGAGKGDGGGGEAAALALVQRGPEPEPMAMRNGVGDIWNGGMNILDLPNEMLRAILSDLPIQDLLACKSVSSKFNAVASEVLGPEYFALKVVFSRLDLSTVLGCRAVNKKWKCIASGVLRENPVFSRGHYFPLSDGNPRPEIGHGPSQGRPGRNGNGAEGNQDDDDVQAGVFHLHPAGGGAGAGVGAAIPMPRGRRGPGPFAIARRGVRAIAAAFVAPLQFRREPPLLHQIPTPILIFTTPNSIADFPIQKIASGLSESILPALVRVAGKQFRVLKLKLVENDERLIEEESSLVGAPFLSIRSAPVDRDQEIGWAAPPPPPPPPPGAVAVVAAVADLNEPNGDDELRIRWVGPAGAVPGLHELNDDIADVPPPVRPPGQLVWTKLNNILRHVPNLRSLELHALHFDDELEFASNQQFEPPDPTNRLTKLKEVKINLPIQSNNFALNVFERVCSLLDPEILEIFIIYSYRETLHPKLPQIMEVIARYIEPSRVKLYHRTLFIGGNGSVGPEGIPNDIKIIRQLIEDFPTSILPTMSNSLNIRLNYPSRTKLEILTKFLRAQAYHLRNLDLRIEGKSYHSPEDYPIKIPTLPLLQGLSIHYPNENIHVKTSTPSIANGKNLALIPFSSYNFRSLVRVELQNYHDTQHLFTETVFETVSALTIGFGPISIPQVERWDYIFPNLTRLTVLTCPHGYLPFIFRYLTGLEHLSVHVTQEYQYEDINSTLTGFTVPAREFIEFMDYFYQVDENKAKLQSWIAKVRDKSGVNKPSLLELKKLKSLSLTFGELVLPGRTRMSTSGFSIDLEEHKRLTDPGVYMSLFLMDPLESLTLNFTDFSDDCAEHLEKAHKNVKRLPTF